MGKARNIADLLDDNGDVKSASLDNVPASNNASALTTGTIAAARLDTATTQSASNNSTKIATTAYTDNQIATVVDSAPGTLDTLNELAAALGDDANFSTTVTNSIAAKLPLAGGELTGNLTIPNNRIGVGTSSPSVPLQVRTSLSSVTQTTPETVLLLETTAGTGDMAVGNGTRILFKISDDETNPSVGASIDAVRADGDDSISSTDLVFSASQNDETLDEALRIASDGTIATPTGSPLSYEVGSEHKIHTDPGESISEDTNTSQTWLTMKKFYAVKSGKIRVRWEGYIQSGTYYWAGEFHKNGTLMKKSDGTTDAHHGYHQSLASGFSDAVHNYRTFQMDLDDVKPGDLIEYKMASSNGSGSIQDGNGQDLHCKHFDVYSTTPTVETYSLARTARYEMLRNLVTFNTAGIDATMVTEGGQLSASDGSGNGNNWTTWSNVPDWAVGLLAGNQVNTSDTNSVTLACTMTVFMLRSDGWNSVSTSGWTDLGTDGLGPSFGPGGHHYVKTLSAGTHTLDNNSAMYIFTL